MTANTGPDTPRPTSELAADVRYGLRNIVPPSRLLQSHRALHALVARVADLEARRADFISRDTDEKPSEAMPPPGHRDWRETAEWWQSTCVYWHERADAAEAQVAALESQLGVALAREAGASDALDEARAQVAALTREVAALNVALERESVETWEKIAADKGIPFLLDHLGLDGLGNEVNDLGGALATTRQALTDALDYTECKGHCADGGCPFCGGVLGIARRALAATEEDK